MIEILQQNEKYVLEMEKLQNKWWLSLVQKETGLTQTLICDTKRHAQIAFKGMSLEEVQEFVDRMKLDKLPTYKPGYNPNKQGK